MKVEGKILLLGGGGFIGRALSRYLCQRGKNFHILSNHFPDCEITKNITFHKGCIDDRLVLNRILPECNVIIHLASGTTPGSSSRRPSLEVDKNIGPTLRFLDILQPYKNIHVIYLSSGGALYGNPGFVPANENCPIVPLSFYGAGKIAIEKFLNTFSINSEISISIIRPSNVYGPGQTMRTGFGIIRTMLEHAFYGTSMEIWGDGKSVRDYLYIDDLVDAISKIINIHGDNNTYNVGSGIGYDINELKNIIKSVTKREIKTVYRPGRKTDVKEIILDSSRMIKYTGWHPSVSLEKGICLTWNWINKK